MTYKLALKLKEAGFPQDWTRTIWEKDELKELKANWYYTPTLSELIEAVRKFGTICLIEESKDWFVASATKMGGCSLFLKDRLGETEGKTLEVALAKLYLELNK